MNKAPTMQEWHVNRLESLMEQWDFDDGADMSEDQALGVLRAAQESGQTMRQMSRMQGNLSEMRDTLSSWASKPSVILPTLGVTLAGAAYALDLQLSADDAEFMRDMAAITQAEYEEISNKVGEHAERAREVMTGVLGLGVTTAIALNLDRFKKMLTQPGQTIREANGADPDGPRLTHRLSGTEREMLSDVLGRFHGAFKDQTPENREALLQRMVDTISRTERMVTGGESPATSIRERLVKLQERLELIDNQQQAHNLGHTANAPSL